MHCNGYGYCVCDIGYNCENGNCVSCYAEFSSYGDYQNCSTPVRKPGYNYEIDGCSLPHILSELTGVDSDNPTGCADTSFYNGCVAHDKCYQDCGNDKSECDSDLWDAMYNVCMGSSCAYKCSSLYATAYYNAVSDHGDGAWGNDKVKACDCDNCN
jgi:hypothetical protein